MPRPLIDLIEEGSSLEEIRLFVEAHPKAVENERYDADGTETALHVALWFDMYGASEADANRQSPGLQVDESVAPERISCRRQVDEARTVGPEAPQARSLRLNP